MTLEQQVCSLELAKRLKELGVDETSQFYWFGGLLGVSGEFRLRHKDDEPVFFEERYAAFTVAELGERLPWEYSTSSRREKGWYICGERSGSGYSGKSQKANTEANARAKMLIYLIENKLITP